VTLFGTGQVLVFPTIDTLPDPYQFIVRSGRAVMVPAYIGTLERGPTPPGQSPDQFRDHALKYFKDLGRSLDYLETRQDLDIGKLAFYGISLGALHGPRFLALEPRFKAAVLLTGGLPGPWPGEIDPWNYAPRVRVPVLMLNGRDDFLMPLEMSQIPLFRALGTTELHKKHVLYDGGHINLMMRPEVIAEVLDWLDRYLGRVPAPQ
jgi:pimeloyl-ACP methyl ester carboxylesterase